MSCLQPASLSLNKVVDNIVATDRLETPIGKHMERHWMPF